MTPKLHWYYGTRDRGTRWEYRWRRCPKCGNEDYPYHFATSRAQWPKNCAYCGWHA